jgi:hypothetical protein
MSYKINKTDGTLLVDLIDGTINTESSDITLIGRNYKGFGELINENFVKMLENFASSSAPANPLRGQLWYDTSENRLKVYNGTEFSTNGIIVSATQPNLSSGDIWIDSLNNQMKFFDGSDLVLVGPIFTESQGVSGFVTESKLDTQNQNRTILKFFVGNTLIGVWSAAEFTPVTSQLISELVSGSNPTGAIFKGFNLVDESYKYRGIAFKAESLIDNQGSTILAASLLRSDANDTTTGTITINNNDGLIVGASGQGHLTVSSVGDVMLTNVVNAKKIKLRVTNITSVEEAMVITSNTRLVQLYPGIITSTVEVGGNLTVQGDLTVQGTNTTVNTTNLTVEDKNITIANVLSPTDVTADGAGFTIKGASDKTFNWVNATDAFTSSEHIDLTAGKEYKINGVTVLSATALGSTIASAPGLTSLGVLTQSKVDNLTLNSNKITTKEEVLSTITATGTGSTATLTFSTQGSPPYGTGETIVVAGITPVGYNGTHVVTACTINSVSYTNITTAAQTVPGTITQISPVDLVLESGTNIINVGATTEHTITGLALPTAASHATRKDYVDGYLPISLVADITGFSALSAGVNGSIANLLTDLYPPLGMSGTGLGIPASVVGRIAMIHTVEFGSLNVTIPGANLESALDESFTAVDQTIQSATAVTVVSVQTYQSGAASLDPGHIRITTTNQVPNTFEVDQLVTITGCQGTVSTLFAAPGINGTDYVISKVITPGTVFDIDLSTGTSAQSLAGIDAEPGGNYNASSAAVTRTIVVGASNKTVLQDIAFDTVTGTVGSVASRGLKRFILTAGTPPTWQFNADLTSTVI